MNGILVAYLGLPSFIVTLGMLEMARGMAYLTTNSQTMYIGASIQKLALPISGTGISLALIIAFLTVFAAQFILTKTVPGRNIIAVGANAQAARMSGIDTKLYRMLVLAVSGALAGLGGIFNIAYLGAADPNAGIGLELAAIAAAVIGGTSLRGGGVLLSGHSQVCLLSRYYKMDWHR